MSFTALYAIANNALDDDAKEGLKEWAQSEIIPIPNYVMHGRSDDPIWLPKGSASALKRKVKIPEKKRVSLGIIFR